MKRLLLFALSCLFAASLAQASPIADTGRVQEAVKRGAVIWDVRGAAEFKKGHLPGAVNIGHAGVVLRNANTEDFIPVEQIERLLGSAGIDPREEAIVYATRGDPYAYFGLYTLQYFGAKKAFVYHDGIDGWRKAGLSLKPVEQLKRLYAGLDPEKETIVYCQSGVRAAENAQFFNVGLLNGRLAAMGAKIEALERELAEAKAGRK